MKKESTKAYSEARGGTPLRKKELRIMYIVIGVFTLALLVNL